MSTGPVKPLVLIADDDAGTRYVCSETLRHEGFRVLQAADGAEALDLCIRNAPDLVLLDVEMPELSGYDACRAIRDVDTCAHLPVVMVTSHDDRDSINLAYDAGATDFIAKPISWPLLGHRLRYILRSARNLQSLGEALDENRALMAALPDNIFVVAKDGTIIEHLRGDAAPDFGHGQQVAGRNIADVIPARVRQESRDALRQLGRAGGCLAIEYRDRSAPDSDRWYECRFVDHGASRVLAIVRDVTERKRTEARIRRLAYYDALTGLPNRPHFRERAALALERRQGDVAVFIIDIDRFKRINDTLGTVVGDETLIETSRRLKNAAGQLKREFAVRVPDLRTELACFGGNVFGLMLAGGIDGIDLASFAARLGQQLAQPLFVGGHEFVVTASIGVARSPQHGNTVDALTRNAESARHAAKTQGNNSQRVYRSSMNSSTQACLDLENELRRALDTDQLRVHYQPKFGAASGELEGAEALLRWVHPRRGEIEPSIFVGIAEEAGLIGALGAWMINEVCGQIRYWRSAGLKPGIIAVNLSGREFIVGDPFCSIYDAVGQAGISPGDLQLEITETVLMSDIRSVMAALHRLHDAGFSLAVDDFGTGYSSLRYLQRFPVDVVKIDSSFVRDIEHDPNSRSICTAIIALAHGLGLEVVGEGVETAGQEAYLKHAGCDVLQGFRLGKPMAASAFELMLESGKRKSGAPGRRTPGLLVPH